MNIIELIGWNTQETGTEAGAKIPWDDPAFSKRMLENHLAQEHDWASRRQDIIACHTDWIAVRLPKAHASILDLGCGPGLYTQSLAEKGHSCVGVDFSPASIAYAKKQAEGKDTDVEYILGDIRTFKTDRSFDCILMTFGEFNVFTRQDASRIVDNCAEMLSKEGLFILEAHTFNAVKAIGKAPPSWQRNERGLFSDRPHLCLQENIWNETQASALSRFFIIDAESSDVELYCSFMQAYSEDEMHKMMLAAGLQPAGTLDEVTWPPGGDFHGKLQTMICRKAAPS